MTLRHASPRDIPEIATRRMDVGWDAYPWALQAAMRPPHARFFLLTDADGRIAAMGSGIAYGPIGVVGNMVVRPDSQRRGLGSAILEAVIAFLIDERRCTMLELSATPAGRPLYARYGFEPTGLQVRASLPPATAPSPVTGLAMVEATGDDLDQVAAWDARRFGGDRRPILEEAIADPARPVHLARRADALVGYITVRPDASRIGPWLADDLAAAATLLASAAALVAPQADAPLSWSLPGENEGGVSWLASLGARVEPHDSRMRRGFGPARRLETIFATIVGSLG
jgi:GNAT superfamily N-acetyltransferase